MLDFLVEKGINVVWWEVNFGEVFGNFLEFIILVVSVYFLVRGLIVYGLSNSKFYYLLIFGKLKDLVLIIYKLGLLGVFDKGIKMIEVLENVVIGFFKNEEVAEKW